MKVLVTGASGLLGRAVAAATLAAGHEVRTFQRRPSGVPGASDVLGSVTDSGALERAVEGMDAVIHLAAKVSLAGDPAEFDTVNVGGTRALIAALTQGAPAVTSTAASTASREAVSTGPGTASTDAAARRLVYVSSPSVAHSGASISGEPAMPPTRLGLGATTHARKRTPNCSRWLLIRPACRLWPCDRTWSGVRGTPNWSPEWSNVHGPAGFRCSATVPR